MASTVSMKRVFSTTGDKGHSTKTVSNNNKSSSRADPGITYAGQRCDCCPYNYHIDLDFLRYLEAQSAPADIYKSLRKIRHSPSRVTEASQNHSLPSSPTSTYRSSNQKFRSSTLGRSNTLGSAGEETVASSSVTTNEILNEINSSLNYSLFTTDAEPPRRQRPVHLEVVLAPETREVTHKFSSSETTTVDSDQRYRAETELFINDDKEKKGKKVIEFTVPLPVGKPPPDEGWERVEKLVTKIAERQLDAKSPTTEVPERHKTTSKQTTREMEMYTETTRKTSSMTEAETRTATLRQEFEALRNAEREKSMVTSSKLAEQSYLLDQRVNDSGSVSPSVLQAIREQMAISLERMRELEEQVKSISTLKSEISMLREENRRLLLLVDGRSPAPHGGGQPINRQSPERSRVPISETSTQTDISRKEEMPFTDAELRELYRWRSERNAEMIRTRNVDTRSIGVGEGNVFGYYPPLLSPITATRLAALQGSASGGKSVTVNESSQEIVESTLLDSYDESIRRHHFITGADGRYFEYRHIGIQCELLTESGISKGSTIVIETEEDVLIEGLAKQLVVDTIKSAQRQINREDGVVVSGEEKPADTTYEIARRIGVHESEQSTLQTRNTETSIDRQVTSDTVLKDAWTITNITLGSQAHDRASLTAVLLQEERPPSPGYKDNASLNQGDLKLESSKFDTVSSVNVTDDKDVEKRDADVSKVETFSKVTEVTDTKTSTDEKTVTVTKTVTVESSWNTTGNLIQQTSAEYTSEDTSDRPIDQSHVVETLDALIAQESKYSLPSADNKFDERILSADAIDVKGFGEGSLAYESSVSEQQLMTSPVESQMLVVSSAELQPTTSTDTVFSSSTSEQGISISSLSGTELIAGSASCSTDKDLAEGGLRAEDQLTVERDAVSSLEDCQVVTEFKKLDNEDRSVCVEVILEQSEPAKHESQGASESLKHDLVSELVTRDSVSESATRDSVSKSEKHDSAIVSESSRQESHAVNESAIHDSMVTSESPKHDLEITIESSRHDSDNIADSPRHDSESITTMSSTNESEDTVVERGDLASPSLHISESMSAAEEGSDIEAMIRANAFAIKKSEDLMETSLESDLDSAQLASAVAVPEDNLKSISNVDTTTTTVVTTTVEEGDEGSRRVIITESTTQRQLRKSSENLDEVHQENQKEEIESSPAATPAVLESVTSLQESTSELTPMTSEVDITEDLSISRVTGDVECSSAVDLVIDSDVILESESEAARETAFDTIGQAAAAVEAAEGEGYAAVEAAEGEGYAAVGGAEGGYDDSTTELRDPEGSGYDVDEESYDTLVTEKIYDISDELLAACSVYSQWLSDSDTVPVPDMKLAVELIQRQWFYVAGRKMSNSHEVRYYLATFAQFSDNLLSAVVNLPDNDGNTTLHYAVSHGNFDVVAALLESGMCEVNKENRAGYSSLLLVALLTIDTERQKQLVQTLFSLGDVNATSSSSGQTALMLAASHGRLETVLLLLDCGADVNAQDEDGSTALMCASEHGHSEIIKALLAIPDCDSTITDIDGSTALSIAVEEGHQDIGVLLYAHMKNLQSQLEAGAGGGGGGNEYEEEEAENEEVDVKEGKGVS